MYSSNPANEIQDCFKNSDELSQALDKAMNAWNEITIVSGTIAWDIKG